MIKRDIHGFPGQHNAEYSDYLDFGDSAARCGILALCGSKLDQDILTYYAIDGKLVRHPNDLRWKDPKLTSRDQLIQWAAGCRNNLSVYKQEVLTNYRESWFINKDVLTPDVRVYLYLISRNKAPFHLTLFGYPMMFMSLLWACFIRPNEEMNKVLCMCAIFGKWWIRKLVKWHPDLHGNLKEYWSSWPWRDQDEIRQAMWDFIQREIQ